VSAVAFVCHCCPASPGKQPIVTGDDRNRTILRLEHPFKSHEPAIAQSCDPAIVSNCTIVRPTQKKGTTSIPPLRSLQYIFADMPVLQQTAESKAKALQEIRETDFLNYDVLLAHHPDADNHFDGVPSKDAIALLFNSNMVNGIHALCQYPFPDDYDGPVFPMFLVEHQPMDLTGQLDTDEKLNKWEEDMYEQYSEITPDNCPPV
jgi:hypothetical protein